MGKSFHYQGIENVFVLLIFCTFAASVLIVLMLGSSIYKSVSAISKESYDERVCLAYVWTKVKNCDAADSISLGNFDGQQVLLLKEDFNGIAYQTMIYFHEGWVRELFCEEGLAFSPEYGTAVIKAASLSFAQLEHGLIQAESGSNSLLLFPRGSAIQDKGGPQF